MKKHYAPTSTGKTASQPEPVVPRAREDRVPVTVSCHHCSANAVYGVRLTTEGVKYDLYYCDTCERETRIPVK